MALKIIGAGFGRTGTSSLKAALEMVGYAKCYHMTEVFRNPGHIPVWSAAADGRAVDWTRLFEGYRASLDWPGAALWRELIAAFPDAGVILTERDEAAWLRSFSQTIRPTLQAGPPEPPGWAEMARKVIHEGVFGGASDDDEACLAAYRRQSAQVRAEVPADRLLVFDPADGWGPLCDFLGIDAPQAEFPHANTTADFRRTVGLDRS